MKHRFVTFSTTTVCPIFFIFARFRSKMRKACSESTFLFDCVGERELQERESSLNKQSRYLSVINLYLVEVTVIEQGLDVNSTLNFLSITPSYIVVYTPFRQ